MDLNLKAYSRYHVISDTMKQASYSVTKISQSIKAATVQISPRRSGRSQMMDSPLVLPVRAEHSGIVRTGIPGTEGS